MPSPASVFCKIHVALIGVMLGIGLNVLVPIQESMPNFEKTSQTRGHSIKKSDDLMLMRVELPSRYDTSYAHQKRYARLAEELDLAREPLVVLYHCRKWRNEVTNDSIRYTYSKLKSAFKNVRTVGIDMNAFSFLENFVDNDITADNCVSSTLWKLATVIGETPSQILVLPTTLSFFASTLSDRVRESMATPRKFFMETRSSKIGNSLAVLTNTKTFVARFSEPKFDINEEGVSSLCRGRTGLPVCSFRGDVEWAGHSVNHRAESQIQLERIEDVIQRISDTSEWPYSVRKSAAPSSRFDIIGWHLVNETHLFFPSDFAQTRTLSNAEKLDLQTALETPRFSGRDLGKVATIYRKFDVTRGMEYLIFWNSVDNHEKFKCTRLLKPLLEPKIIEGIPFSTGEAKTIHLVTILQKNELNRLSVYLKALTNVVRSSCNDEGLLKLSIVLLGEKFTEDDSNATHIFTQNTWVSKARRKISKFRDEIQKLCPEFNFNIDTITKFDERKSSIIRLLSEKVLPRKEYTTDGDDTIVFVHPISVFLRVETLVKLRISTIQGFQVLVPIPFREYHPEFSKTPRLSNGLPSLSSTSGKFDSAVRNIAAFYVSDFRKCCDQNHSEATVLGVFERCNETMHTLKVIDPFFRSLYVDRSIDSLIDFKEFLGSKKQLASWYLDKSQQPRDKAPE